MKKLAFFIFCLIFLFVNESFSQINTLSGSNSESSVTALESFDSYVQIANASKNYLVTPGDVYCLIFATGTATVKYEIIVDSTYKIKVANLAVINGEGKTFLQLKNQVEEIVNRNYPMSGVQFVITQVAVFNVIVKGEVQNTVEKQVIPLTRLSSMLTGLTSYASTRLVTVISQNGTKKTYDLFKAKRYGDMSQDPFVRPNDTIIVNRYDRLVTITGAVNRPGTYELLKDENLKELVEIYGDGLANRADTSKIEVMRNYDVIGRNARKIYIDKSSIDNNYQLYLNDSIYIKSYNEYQTVVFFEGAVVDSRGNANSSANGTTLLSSNKISVSFQENESYQFLIKRNSGSFLAVSDLKNAYIRRGTEIIPIDIEKILYDNEFEFNEIAKDFDTIVVPFKQSFVTVSGAVKVPGRYPYVPDRTWEYYIGLAGGFIQEQNVGSAIKIVNQNNQKCKKDEVIGPEYTITAQTNSFTYYFNIYAPIITTVLSAISTTIVIITAIK